MKKTIITFAFAAASIGFASGQKTAPQNWFNMDLKKDKYPGVSSDRAYSELLKDRQAKTIIVAVIDGGTDVKHEDLKDIIWVNSKEVAGNGVDDDHNGYIDDINGWNFIGGKDSDVVEDTYEVTRVYYSLKDKYDKMDSASVPASQRREYTMYASAKREYKEKYDESSKMYGIMVAIDETIKRIVKETGTDKPTPEQLKAFKPSNEIEAIALKNIEIFSKKHVSLNVISEQLRGAVDYYGKGLKYGYNPDFDTRLVVGDNYSNQNEHFYGNNHVTGAKAEHGTHVAGIIAAIRNNSIGINGVADHVKIMVLRVVPDGDERDKDVANAIRYAADNGASVINMSFGKSYSPNKSIVDEAVRYAVSKDVLMVHAAGNDGKNTDVENNFPRDVYDGSTTAAETWIEVGASSWQKGKNQAATFSNYGKNNVDLFAPGVSIYSTLPGSTYGSFDGTSMASPVTAGVASIIRAYFPELTAVQVKDILMRSVTPVKGKVIVPGQKKTKMKMSELCQSGGIVNAYNAVKLAEETTSKK